MHDHEYAARVEAVKQRAYGRWTEILANLGVDERILKRRPLPCPVCSSGVDRFQYTDRFGQGNYHCRKCGPGGGFKLLQAVRGIDFNTALCDVERMLGVLPAVPALIDSTPTPDRMKKLVQHIWDEARPVVPGDDVDRYLKGRGLALQNYPNALRCHPALGYFQREGVGKAKKVAEYPAMLARVRAANGDAVTLHRTYLHEGRKLMAPDAKKVLCAGFSGAAVRLGEPGDELALCEGIETGLAVMLATGKPVWSALSAGNLEKVVVPDAVKQICIYADNDADGDFTGQASAFSLARRLMREGNKDAAARSVRVFLPRNPGADWADVWQQRQAVALRHAA
ncbi:MAG: toprim domain-containing protein [Burkholderiales bacterium]|nr:toprim domain-containing protein [Burkholderiales bacterium]